MPAILALTVGLCLVLGWFMIGTSPLWPIAVVVSGVTFIMAFLRPKAGLILLIFSMLLSPQLGVGGFGKSRDILLRYDDLLLIVVSCCWLVKGALAKSSEPLSFKANYPVLGYGLICVVSTLLAIGRGDMDWAKASLYTLKYLEYLLLYFLANSLAGEEKDIKEYLILGLITALIVTGYGYWYYFTTQNPAIAPFEVPVKFSAGAVATHEGEPGSLGGYYIVVFGVLLGLFSQASRRYAVVSLSALAAMLPVFLLTFSRASYVGLAGAFGSLLFINRKRQLYLFAFLGLFCLAFTTIKPLRDKVTARVEMTYLPSANRELHDFNFLGFKFRLEDSAAQRVWAWQRVLTIDLPNHPLLGAGVTGIGFEDTQYGTTLGEIGILGMVVFIWMIMRIFGSGWYLYTKSPEPWIKGLGLGLVIGLAGLLCQAMTSNTFIVVRIMEPFWFTVGLVDRLCDISKASERTEA
jgi:hypothetical protein